jgi:5-methylcytosine-specific restriction endonuclease McrA
MKRALLLNHDYVPLHFLNDVDAIILFYKGRAEIVSGSDGKPSVWNETFKSPSTTIHVPATMRLLKKINKKWKQPRFRKKVLFNRDNWSCQYCSEKLYWDSVTIDHVMPSSRGGQTSWLNCVASCKQCNKSKANKTPEEAGMKLLKKPTVPTSFHFWDTMSSSVWHNDWKMFLKE